MKCSACENKECERKYENRFKCVGEKEGIKCTCTCQVSLTEEIATSFISVTAGIAVFAGGVTLTMMTGGIPLIMGGAALIGTGSTLVINPIQKQITGEHLTIKDTARDVAFGATIGAITGPIGVGGSLASKGASTLVKFGFRMGAGAVAGGVSGAASEASRKIKGEELTTGSFLKAVGISAIAGAVGGASTHMASGMSSLASNGVAKSITRVSVQAASTVATDVGLQYYEKRELSKIDPKQVLLNTVGQIAMATTAEVTQNVTKRTEAYAKKANLELVNDNFGKDQDKMTNADETKQRLISAEKEVNSLSPKVQKDNMQKVNDYNKVQEKISHLETHKENIRTINASPDLNGEQKANIRGDYLRENNLHINKKISFLKAKATDLRPQQMGDKNMHYLHGDRTGQVAVDLFNPDPETGRRTGQRVILEKIGENHVYIDHTLDHNYSDCRQGVKNFLSNPFEALRPEQIIREFTTMEEEEESRTNNKKND